MEPAGYPKFGTFVGKNVGAICIKHDWINVD